MILALLSFVIAPGRSLAELAVPANYTAGQFSSYDRASTSPKDNWFANADYGQYLRNETIGTRTEHVMAEMTGPGEVVRIWSANPSGVIRIYFDGEPLPRIEKPLQEYLSTNDDDGIAYEAARGFNRFGAIKYSRSLKMTIDETGAWKNLYYHVDYKTWTGEEAIPIPSLSGGDLRVAEGRVSSGEPVELSLSGGASQFSVEVDPKVSGATLRNLLLTIEADGAQTVVSPLGDFFCVPVGLTPFTSTAMEVTDRGRMTCFFPQTAKKSLKIRVSTRDRKSTPVVISARENRGLSGLPYRFHAQYSRDRGNTRPMRDMTFLEATGEGRYVGTSIHIENPVPGWWGEGDEKIYVDGEKFPSFFGTGTEDYLGYAWSNPALFLKPFHGQLKCDGPGTFGHSTIFRWHIVDDIPFRKSLKFDMEMWHWAEVVGTWDRVAYWYALPGGTGNHPIKIEPLAKLLGPQPVKGAIEGEKLKITRVSGGKHEAQGGFSELSSGEQRWWIDPKLGDELVFELTKPSAGNRFNLIGNFCLAKDYGKHRITFNGKLLKEIDFYSPTLTWKKLDLGKIEFVGPTGELRIECMAPNPAAEPRNMFGLDYLLLKGTR
ncbi:MAG: glycoside hydrolase family 172 protein [Fimbriimonadaceae bacterium]